jgi:alkylation response protein AidB-like acyl-CoA dehydrogenase
MSEQPLAEFLDQATRFLETAAGRAPAATSRAWGEGPDGTELLAEWSSEEEARLVTEARRFKALEYDAGFGWIDGPAVYGGRGLPRSYHEAYARLREQFAVPDLAVMRLGLSMTAPTILAHGTEQVKRAYLPRLHRGDVIACQLFSEPDAGSDLASLRTSAMPDGDGWVLRGQKVWTTNAHLSDIGGSLDVILDRLVMLARWSGRLADPAVRDLVSDTAMHILAARAGSQRAHEAAATGQPGPEQSVGKLLWTQNLQRVSRVVSELLGPRLVADTGEWGTYAWAKFVLAVPGIRISAGTDEIMRNILAERVLGLPREKPSTLNQERT